MADWKNLDFEFAGRIVQESPLRATFPRGERRVRKRGVSFLEGENSVCTKSWDERFNRYYLKEREK